MRKIAILTLLFVAALPGFSRNYKLRGTISDNINREKLIGANVKYNAVSGTVTNVDGDYFLDLPEGIYNIIFSYVGYGQVKKTVNLNKDIVLNVEMKQSAYMKEITVVGGIARARETPVAFSTLSPKDLAEDLASQDIPMALNSTPGVYATQEGGGEGDAQITIRGFSSRNVGVLLDGVPVNDMENGTVYWSNWFGLDAVTRSLQVQRGLGASKLALPSVGGTINIITKGIENRRGGSVKQEVGSDGFVRTSFGYNSGKMKNGWSFSVAGSYKRGDGYADRLWFKGFFYYAKIDRKIGNHIVSLSGYGAPQKHAQRSYKVPVTVYDSAYAEKLGIKLHYSPGMDAADSSEVKVNLNKAGGWGLNRGIRFNQHWGYLARTKDNSNAKAEHFNERVNEYHKPQITLKDSWTVNDDLFISNILYASIGNGGGIRSKHTIGADPETGQMDFQGIYDGNISDLAIDGLYDGTEHGTNNYLRRLVNSHRWYGLLSTFNYKNKTSFTYSGGVDLRYYKGIHYEEIYDLLGADYVKRSLDELTSGQVAGIDWTDEHPLSSFKLNKGDKAYYNEDCIVKWGGLFFQTEYKTDKLSAFINLTGALSRYKRIDYWTYRYLGNTKDISKIKTFPGYTVKLGANYNFNDNMNVFFNAGYLNKAPRFSNVYDYNNLVYKNIKNETVASFEGGYTYHSPLFSANINLYYTDWGNRPVDKAITISEIDENGNEVELSANINGMAALHKGMEFDFSFEPLSSLSVQGLVSLGDWKWNSRGSARLYNEDHEYVRTVDFDAKGVHVGNSAQTQLAGMIRWEPFDNFYIKPKITYFDRYYAAFDPMSLDGSADSYDWYDESTGKHGDPKESWEIPDYYIVDLHAGYLWKIKDKTLSVRLNILNLFDKEYIATAQDNDTYNGTTLTDHDAKSASVFMGLGRRYNMSVGIKF